MTLELLTGKAIDVKVIAETARNRHRNRQRGLRIPRFDSGKPATMGVFGLVVAFGT